MIVPWLVYGLLVSGLLGAAAWLAEKALRERGWAGRWPWAGALAGSVAFPAWAWLTPSAEPVAGGPLPGALVMEALPPLVLDPASSAGPSVEGLLALAWGAGSGLLLLWLWVAVARLAAASRRWPRVEVEGVPVLVSDRTGPAAMGLLRGRVVLPRWALDLAPAQRRLMVLHEAEHVRARDPQLAVAGLLVCALMPWNVAAWWQLRRLRLAMEVDCDARVLRRAGDVRSYGALLLEVGQRRRARLAVGLAETRTSLEWRIRMMTRTRTGRRTLRGLGLAGLSGLMLAVACETPGPTDVAEPEAREVELEDVQGIMKSRAGFGGADCEPTYYLNGAPYAGDVSTIAAGDIERIEVYKGAAPQAELGACGLIRILTHDATAEERAAVEALTRRLQTAQARTGERSREEMEAAPAFTPMHVRPQLRNAAEVREQLMANYPPLLRDAGIGGTANVWFFIDETGAVKKLQINQSSRYDALDQAALRVASTMEFTPAQLDGEPVPVWVALDITFETEAEAEAKAGAPAREKRVGELSPRGAEVRRTPREPNAASLAAAPRFTPMTVRPQLRNAAEVKQNLMRHYPPLLRDAGIGGTAMVWFFIEEDGTVGNVAIAESSGHAALDEAALAVARTMSFTPAKNGDEPVPVWVALEITFEVEQ